MAAFLIVDVEFALAKVREVAAASSNLSREIEQLQVSLQRISAILVDGERRRMQDKTIKLWCMELKEVLYDADNILDRYSDEQLKEQQAPVCCRSLPLFTRVGQRHGIAISVRNINDRLKKIAKDRATYKLTPNLRPTECVISPRTSSLLPPNIVGLGIEEDTRVLSSFLLNTQKRGNQLLAITGMGGIGKTTLAQKIYNDPHINQYFEMRLWVLVSQNFNETDILRGIISDGGFSVNVPSGVTKQKLEEFLFSMVEMRRVLIVLDDVWSVDVWEHVLRNSLQGADLGSKFLVTTRDEDIANQMGASLIHHVKPLGPEDSWFLLRKMACVAGDEAEIELPSNVGKKIVEKCEGLPLALKSVGEILRNKEPIEREWSEVLQQLENITNVFDKGYMSALYMSYEALPSSTKPCFLYCSLLPQNKIIARKELLQMWISEGFVESKPCDSSPEDLAEVSYAKMVTTNLLQSHDCNQSDHGCKIHDLIRDLAIILAEDDNYSRDLGQVTNGARIRRLSVGSREKVSSLKMISDHKGLRSLLIFDNPLLDNNMLKGILSHLKYLRVLDLRGTSIGEVPNNLGKLFHLRYLNLSCTRIQCLPSSIKDVKKLLFLNLNGCMDLVCLPTGITQLHNLRSLDIRRTKLNDMPKGFGSLKDLNTLLGFVTMKSSLEELKDLELIRYLDIRKLDTAVRAGEVLQNKSKLRSLVLSWEIVECEVKDILKKLGPQGSERDPESSHNNHPSSISLSPRHAEGILEDLKPRDSLEQLTIECYPGFVYPTWITSPSSCRNLTDLNLKSCVISMSLPPLGQLPRLKILQISASKRIVTIDTKFYGETGLAFPKLEKLVIKELYNLEEWRGPGNGKAFPILRELHLEKCSKLRSLPQCLQFSTALTKLVMEEADSIKIIEDLCYLSDLRIKDCPNLERIVFLAELKTLKIIRCPLLQDVEGVNALQHLILDDFAMEFLPGWLTPHKLPNLDTLEITGNRDLIKRLEDGPERGKIATILHIYLRSA